ncbi:MAG: hypothetical protein JWN80_2457, partial [Microbacteriaceae bacterium]|nr:hypothetical protein [Microbacteriaceae bacterium]
MALDTTFRPVGTSGVSVASSVTAAGTVAVSILSSAAASEDGLSGLVVKLSTNSSARAAVKVQIPTAVLASEFGADYASRVRWVQVAVPGTATKTLISKSTVTAVASTSSNGAVELSPLVGATPIFVTAMATPVSSTGTGSFAATPLKVANMWDVSAQTGDFSWSYPMRTPPAAAGPSPQLGLQYSSQAVDGETGSTNNQSSVVGDGWDLSAGGFIERSYVGCSQDDGSSGPVTSSGDLCWKTDNATISVAGHSGQLIKDQTTGVWKLQSDDGSRIEHLTGQAQGCGASNGTYDDDCWRMTTTDGTQYYFGLDKLPGWSSGKPTTGSAWTVPVFGNDASEPCHAATFAASSCVQAWRWNLDYVVDPHANAEALYYNQQTNSYSQNGGAAVSYVRGGQLDHIDYGLASGNIFATNAASDRVVFTYDSHGRCSDATGGSCTTEPAKGNAVVPANPSFYPDTPFDQLCTSASCPNLLSPTFWSTSMLTTVSTQYFDAASGKYLAVDRWDLQHSFPNPGDGSSAALWLAQVTHTGTADGKSIAEPPTTFVAEMMQNRVWLLDGLSALDKERLNAIDSPTGARTSVNYSSEECTPQNAAAILANLATNTMRCFPQWWTADTVYPRPAQKDLFNVYVATSVISDPGTGGGGDLAQETYYNYPATGVAWRYNTSALTPDSQRTWSVFAGYDTVEVLVGDPRYGPQQTTDYTFYRGLDQDHTATAGQLRSATVTGYPSVTDSLWLAGQTLDTKVRLGVGGAVLSDTVTTPWSSAVTANDGTITARMVATGDTTSTVPLAAGGTRTTETKTTFDPTYGLPLTVDTITPDAGTTCTTTSYAAPNVAAWMIAYPKEVAVVAADCSAVAKAVYPAADVSDVRTSYDQGAWGVMPTRGDLSMTSVVDGYKGKTAATAKWVTASTASYDSMGRVLKSTDVLGHATSTAYTPAAGTIGAGALTSMVSTNSLNWSTTTSYDPAWGVETTVVDANGNSTDAVYDALGRRIEVWLPLNPRSDDPEFPSISYDYTESNTAASAVETSTLSARNGPISSFTLYDGLGRQVQTQTEGTNFQDSDVSDTRYDTAGRVVFVDGPYETGLAASAILIVPNDQRVGSQTVTQYDAAGRVTASILETGGSEVSRTTTAYHGADQVDVTPPSGGTPSTTFSNSLGQTTSLTQYLGATIAAGVPTEKTSYTYNPLGKMSGMTDPAGNRWSWSFDVLGHQISAVDPDTGTTKSTYDDAGELLTSTDGRGQTLAYSYDTLGRKTAEYSGASVAKGSLLDSWTFDTLADGQLAKGQLASSSSYIGSKVNKPGAAYTETVTGYDAAYDPTGTIVSIPAGAPAFGGTTYETDLDYYVNGQVEDQTDPVEGGLPGETIEYSYDDFGNINSLSGLSLLLGDVVYTPLHQVQLYERLDGNVYDYTDFGYDPATGRNTEIINYTADVDSSNPVTQSDDIIAYNPAGNVTSETTTSDTTATDTQCFGYDPLQDLTQAWTPANADCTAAPSTAALGGPAAYWSQYTVDPATGNRLTSTTSPTAVGATATTATYAYPAAGAAHPHAVKSVKSVGSTTTTAAYTYDKAGDTITRPGQKLTYDATGKLSTVSVGKTVQSNVYDAS